MDPSVPKLKMGKMLSFPLTNIRTLAVFCFTSDLGRSDDFAVAVFRFNKSQTSSLGLSDDLAVEIYRYNKR